MREPPQTSALQVRVTGDQQVQLMRLVELGYGDGKTPASVVEYMIARTLDDLRRAGIFFVNTR